MVLEGSCIDCDRIVAVTDVAGVVSFSSNSVSSMISCEQQANRAVEAPKILPNVTCN